MSIVDEIWKDVTGYEGYYQVSNLGRARSCDRTIYDGRWGDRFRKGKPVSANLGKRGYVYVPLCKLGKSSTMLLHRLVANEKVLEIRRLSAQGLKDAAIAPMFGISRVTVYDIRTRKTWKHI